jgi:hypothetical protein
VYLHVQPFISEHLDDCALNNRTAQDLGAFPHPCDDHQVLHWVRHLHARLLLAAGFSRRPRGFKVVYMLKDCHLCRHLHAGIVFGSNCVSQIARWSILIGLILIGNDRGKAIEEIEWEAIEETEWEAIEESFYSNAIERIS